MRRLLVLAVVLTAGCAAPEPAPPTSPSVTPPAKEAHVVATLAAPADAFLGDEVPITLRLSNVGETDARADAGASFDGAALHREEVRLSAGETVERAWRPRAERLGLLVVEAAGQLAKVRVRLALPPLDDGTGPGIPEQKRPFAVPEGYPAAHLAYDDAYEVFSRDVHGTRVVVAIHRSLLSGTLGGAQPMAGEAFAAQVFDAFHRDWRVFGGHAYDEWRLVLHGRDDGCAFYSASAVGFPVCYRDAAQSPDDHGRPPHPLTRGVDELVLHETFHAWNGGTIRAMPRNASGFTPEAWFVEGVTAYYAARGMAREDSLAEYDRVMRVEADGWRRAAPDAAGLSFEELAARTPPPRSGPSPFVDMLYHRGALVAYLLDVELTKHNATLDDALRRLYEAHGVTDAPFETKDVQAAAEAAAGAPLDAFFDAYVWGSADPPLDVPFVDHVNHRVVPVA